MDSEQVTFKDNIKNFSLKDERTEEALLYSVEAIKIALESLSDDEQAKGLLTECLQLKAKGNEEKAWILADKITLIKNNAHMFKEGKVPWINITPQNIHSYYDRVFSKTLKSVKYENAALFVSFTATLIPLFLLETSLHWAASLGLAACAGALASKIVEFFAQRVGKLNSDLDTDHTKKLNFNEKLDFIKNYKHMFQDGEVPIKQINENNIDTYYNKVLLKDLKSAQHQDTAFFVFYGVTLVTLLLETSLHWAASLGLALGAGAAASLIVGFFYERINKLSNDDFNAQENNVSSTACKNSR